MKKIFFTLAVIGGLGVGTGTSARAVDGLYLGGQVGFVGLGNNLSNAYNNGLGFGVDIGFRTNPLLDVVLSATRSSHSSAVPVLPDLTLYTTTIAAQFHFLQIDDFDLSILGGPGFYFFNNGTSFTNFGLHGGVGGDVVIDDSFHVGIAWKYHAVFGGNNAQSGSFWTVMMRVGYVFDLGG